MSDCTDRRALPLTEDRLRAALRSSGVPDEGIAILCYDIVGSTNVEAMRYGESHGEDAIFISEEQTAGRGRLGRSFCSPSGGLYLSILTHPEGGAADVVSITARCAVAVCRAIERLTPINCGIKWVNDIFVSDKKLGGILTQGRVGADGSLEFAVIGIGVNLLARDLGAELSAITTSLEGEGVPVPDRCALAAGIYAELKRLDGAGDATDAALDEYRRRSVLTDRSVRVVTPQGEYPARVCGIDSNYRLLIERDGGAREALSTGEVSIRAALANEN